MMNYKMEVSYDGTKYNGWQKQGNTKNTIQEKLENILRVMVSHKVEIHGSGRTDKGVHAISQVASFKISTDKTCEEILLYLNQYLPEDIAVTSLCETDERFHARLNAKRKTYIYRIWNTPIHNPFENRFIYQIADKLNIDEMERAAKLFEGEHDFLGFSSVKKTKKSTVRKVFSAEVKRCGEEVRLEISGSGFLHNMVRIIAGTILEVGMEKRDAGSILTVFETGTRSLAGETLPARGLTLVSVEY